MRHHNVASHGKIVCGYIITRFSAINERKFNLSNNSMRYPPHLVKWDAKTNERFSIAKRMNGMRDNNGDDFAH